MQCIMKFTKQQVKQIIKEEIEKYIFEQEPPPGLQADVPEEDPDLPGSEEFEQRMLAIKKAAQEKKIDTSPTYDDEEAEKANAWTDVLDKMANEAFVKLATKLLQNNAKLLKSPEGVKTLADRIMFKTSAEGEAILDSPEVSKIRDYIYTSNKPSIIRDDMKNFQDEQAYIRKTLNALLGNIRTAVALPDMVKVYACLYPELYPNLCPDIPTEDDRDGGIGDGSDDDKLVGKLKGQEPPPSLEFPTGDVEDALEDFLETDEYVNLTPTLLISPQVMKVIAQRK